MDWKPTGIKISFQFDVDRKYSRAPSIIESNVETSSYETVTIGQLILLRAKYDARGRQNAARTFLLFFFGKKRGETSN